MVDFGGYHQIAGLLKASENTCRLVVMKKPRIGTSAFTARGWDGTFYPRGTKRSDYLSYYAQRFDIAEIDSTFY